MRRTAAEKLMDARRGREREHARGFEDGRAGRMRAHGGNAYMDGYADGLDAYDCEHAEEEGWDDTHCQAGS